MVVVKVGVGIINYTLDMSNLRFPWNIKVEMSRKGMRWNLGEQV